MVKRRGRAYPEMERDAAVEMYLSGPEGIITVAKTLGMSPSTLQTWITLHRAAHPEDKR